MIYMDVTVINDIQVLEEDVKQVTEKCQKVNCSAVFDAIAATFKLFLDLIFMCCKQDESVKI